MILEMIMITLGMVTVLNGLGLALSYWIVLKKPQWNRLHERQYDVSTLNRRLRLIGFNLATIYVITYVGITLLGDFLVMEPIAWWLLLLQCWLISFFDDAYFFFFHRWLHLNKTLYRAFTSCITKPLVHSQSSISMSTHSNGWVVLLRQLLVSLS